MIYLDTNILIYAIEQHPKYGVACKNILQKIQDKKIEACCSLSVLLEVINVLNRINKILEHENKILLNIQENVEAILDLPINWFDINFVLIRHSAKYSFKISPTDYIHIASMELNSIFEIISADQDFDKIPFLKRIDPLEY